MDIAQQIFKQIGFPTHEPFISQISNIIITRGGSFTLEKQEQSAEERLKQALKYLVNAAASLRQEALDKDSKEDRNKAPILLFDELHDLIKRTRLYKEGGKSIFSSLATDLINEGVTHKYIRSVVAGSSTEVLEELEKRKLYGKRIKIYNKQDLDDNTMIDFLLQKKKKAMNNNIEANEMSDDKDESLYTREELEKLINVCGTRLRTLEDILDTDEKVNIDDFIEEVIGLSKRAFDSFFEGIDVADRIIMVDIFESIYNKEEVTKVMLPKAVLAKDYNKVLFISSDNCVDFQDPSCRYVWQDVKKKLSKTVHDPVNVIEPLRVEQQNATVPQQSSDSTNKTSFLGYYIKKFTDMLFRK
jgi:hypothetical protein